MCILCRRQIITGQQIGLLPSGWWAHAECITTANHQEPS
jgi:hypothetical protein